MKISAPWVALFLLTVVTVTFAAFGDMKRRNRSMIPAEQRVAYEAVPSDLDR